MAGLLSDGTELIEINGSAERHRRIMFAPLRPGRRRSESLLLPAMRGRVPRLFMGQYFFQNPVHYQVRIAPDRRSEMGITRRSQSKVSRVLLRITRLLQRPQHQVSENSLFRLACPTRRSSDIQAWCCPT